MSMYILDDKYIIKCVYNLTCSAYDNRYSPFIFIFTSFSIALCMYSQLLFSLMSWNQFSVMLVILLVASNAIISNATASEDSLSTFLSL